MFTFAEAMRTIDEMLQSESANAPLALHTPLQFDPTLLDRLIAGHGELNALFAALLWRLDDDPEAAAHAIGDCANRLRELRRSEALWLYPVIARGVDRDTEARRQLVQLRLLMLALARRVLRRLDGLLEALQEGTQLAPAADQASAALAEYVRRNETEIYPLYTLAGVQLPSAMAWAA